VTTRICLETATAARDEILPGDALSVTLRMKISEARAAGDEALVLELRDRYRRRPVPGRSWVSGGVTLSRTATGRPAAVTATATVLHTASSAESTVRSASRREIVGWLVTWGEGLASNDRGEVIYLDVQPADVRDWLSEVDPAEIPVKGDHLTAVVGRWHRFAMSNYGLMGVASIERSPAGDTLPPKVRAFLLPRTSAGATRPTGFEMDCQCMPVAPWRSSKTRYALNQPMSGASSPSCAECSLRGWPLPLTAISS